MRAPIKDKLTATFSSWELRLQQARRDDRISPGSEEEFRRALYEYVGSVVRDLATEMDGWTKRCDDAKRIPDVLREHADFIVGFERTGGD